MTQLPEVQPPNSRQAEEAVCGLMLSHPGIIAGVMDTRLEPGDFFHPHTRLMFEQMVERFYADEPIDALLVAEAVQAKLAKMLRLEDPQEAVGKVTALSNRWGAEDGEKAIAHAVVVKSHADMRALLSLTHKAVISIQAEEQTPQEIAGGLAQEAMKIATDLTYKADVVSYGNVGRNFVRTTQRAMAARAQGIEVGVFVGYRFMDDFTNGIRGSELFVLGGPPGVGKSSVAWDISRSFARRQMKKQEDRRIGTLIISLEMAEEPSAIRLAQSLTGLDGGKVRRGEVTQSELTTVTNQWAAERDIPLYFNFTSMLTASAMRAMVSEAVRQHNVGFVVIDHFRYFNMDRRHDNPNVEDDNKVRFLKEGLAKELDVAVMCLAHTTKSIETEDRRPTMNHLRGSGQIAADADFVGFVHRPYLHASETAKSSGSVKPSDAEMIYAKNRHGDTGTGLLEFIPAQMALGDR